MKWLRTVGVVALVAVVVALFVEMIKRTHAAAERAQCSNNLKTIGLALHGYHDANKRIPRAIALPPTNDFPPDAQLSWINECIPYLLAHMDPKWIVDRKLPWDHPDNHYVASKEIWSVWCPSVPKVDSSFPLTHYVGVTGIGKDAGWLPLDHPDAGAFGYERVVKLTDFSNGLEKTIMVAETATENGPWIRGGPSTVRGFDRHGAAYLGNEGQFSSFHGGYLYAFTTQVAMGDGSVRVFTADTADVAVEALATLAPKK